MSSVTIAVDLAKHVFELAVSTEAGRITERKRLSRPRFERFWTDRLPCRVGIEACARSQAGQDLSRLRRGARERADAGHRNRAAVALSTTMARVVWAVWKHERSFNGNYLPQAA